LNLTLLAVLNGLPPQKMQAMVHKVDSLMRSSESAAKKYCHTSIYDAFLNIKRFRSKLRPSPIEVNNIKWLMVSDEQDSVSNQMANVARLVMDSSGGSSTETARVLKSVYGEDYAKIDSRQIAERLHLTSGLLETIDTKPKSEEIKTEVLNNNLKESLHQNDRAAFLDSLQLLVDRLKQPKNSLSVLLEDLYQNPSVIRFADRKAFMLGNRLVRSYSKEIVSYNITPEDVLLSNAGIDQKITRYAAWKSFHN
jgi:hypothetical protein